VNADAAAIAPVLLVDDDESLLKAASLALRAEGLSDIITCSDARQVLELLEQPLGVVVLDLSMPYRSGRELLVEIVARHPDLPVLVMTGQDDVATAVACMRDGAEDFLVKPVEPARLWSAVRRALDTRVLRAELGSLQHAMLTAPPGAPAAFAHILTRNREMLGIFRYLETMARTTQPLLLAGETGTGKGLLAEAIHRASGRQGPFIAVSVAGMDDDAFAETMFGRAMSNGRSAQTGALQAAANGTLFIDEVASLPVASQAALVRLLRDGEFSLVGKFERKRSRARLVAATTSGPDRVSAASQLQAGLKFRFQREVAIPPLRRRPDDLPLLVTHFIDHAAQRIGRSVPRVPEALYQLLRTYAFPGNVLELKQMCHDALARHERGNTLGLATFRELAGLVPSDRASPPATDADHAQWLTDPLPTLREMQERLVTEAMRRAGENQGVAAALLGLTRRQLQARWQRIRAHRSG